MTKTTLFIATAIIAFCIIPIATTQAMLLKIEGQSSIADKSAHAIKPILQSCDVVTEPGNPLLKDNLVTLGIQQLRTTTIARGGSRPAGNRNPYVKRRGYGDSTMGDDYVEEDENEGEDEGEEEEEDEEDLNFGDDSAVDYNRDL